MFTILCGVTGLGVHKIDIIGPAPVLKLTEYEFRTIVAADVLRFSGRPDDILQCPYQSGCGYRYCNLLCHCGAVKIIYYVQNKSQKKIRKRERNRIIVYFCICKNRFVAAFDGKI